MGDLTKLSKQFEKTALEAKQLQQRMHSMYEDMGYVLGKYFEMTDISEDEAQHRLGFRPNKVQQPQQSLSLKSAMPQQVSEEQGPCWKGYKQIGMKEKDGRQVPNCVPNESVVKENKSDCGCNENHDCGCGGHHKH
jgi:division protein CdvB (Snf7/Vps24/ESCRT-III family)